MNSTQNVDESTPREMVRELAFSGFKRPRLAEKGVPEFPEYQGESPPYGGSQQEDTEEAPQDNLQWTRALEIYDADTRITLLRTYANFLAAAQRAGKSTEKEELKEKKNSP